MATVPCEFAGADRVASPHLPFFCHMQMPTRSAVPTSYGYIRHC